MKLTDFDRSIDVIDAEVVDILDRLDGMDPTSEEYEKAARNLKTLQEAKSVEVRNKSEHLNGKVPTWATTIAGSAIAVFFGVVVMKVEKGGGVISSQAINMWDKVVRKIG